MLPNWTNPRFLRSTALPRAAVGCVCISMNFMNEKLAEHCFHRALKDTHLSCPVASDDALREDHVSLRSGPKCAAIALQSNFGIILKQDSFGINGSIAYTLTADWPGALLPPHLISSVAAQCARSQPCIGVAAQDGNGAPILPNQQHAQSLFLVRQRRPTPSTTHK